MREKRRPIALQMRPGERRQDQADADPAHAGQRQWWYVTCDLAREHDVTGPEQRGQAEQQIKAGWIASAAGIGVSVRRAIQDHMSWKLLTKQDCRANCC